MVEASAPAPQRDLAALFRRYGYFEGEFPLPIVDRGA